MSAWDQAGLMGLLKGKWVTQAVSTAASLGIADALAKGPLDVAALAQALSLHAPSLERLMRALASEGVFTVDPEGRFGLTAVGAELKTGALRELARFVGSAPEWTPWTALEHAVRTGETAFERVHGTNFYAYLERHPDHGELFDRAIEDMTRTLAPKVADAYDWSSVRTVVDVGGGRGTLLRAILGRHAHLDGILFDLPHVISRAEASRDPIPRCRYVGGDYFESVPPGGDVYLLKHVLHNWDDSRAAAILAEVRQAMGERGRVLIVEAVMIPGDHPDVTKLFDLEMMVLLAEGRERYKGDFRQLLRKAGLTLVRSAPLEGGLRLLEAAPARLPSPPRPGPP